MSLQVQTLPMDEDTRDLIDVFIEEADVNVIPFTNGTGSAINDRTFIIDSSGKWAGVVQGGAVADGAVGDLRVEEGILIQADDLVYGEATFATLGQPVYFKASTGEFSDTWTAGYYLVGILRAVKDSNGMIKFEKFRYAEVQVTPSTVYENGEIGYLEYKVAADASSGIDVDFGFNFTILDVVAYSEATVTSETLTLQDSSGNAITDALDIDTVDTRETAATIDGASNGYNVISDGTVKFVAASAAGRARVLLLVKGV